MTAFKRSQGKYGDWRKLHIAVSALTGEIIACDLTSKSARDASRLPALLKQIDGPLASVRADGSYDKTAVYVPPVPESRPRAAS